MRPTTEPAPARRASPRGRRACRGARNRPAARDGAGSNARPPLPRTRKRARARRAAASTCNHEGRGMLLPFHPPPPPPPPRLLGCCSMALCRGMLVLAFSMGVKIHLGGGCGILSLFGTNYFLVLCYICRLMQSGEH